MWRGAEETMSQHSKQCPGGAQQSNNHFKLRVRNEDINQRVIKSTVFSLEYRRTYEEIRVCQGIDKRTEY